MLVLLFLIAPYAGASDSSPPPRQTPPPPSWPDVTEVDLTEACRGDRWIGVLAGEEPGYCPPPWERVFATDEVPPPGLRRFCMYTGDDPRPELRRIEDGRLFYGSSEKTDGSGSYKKGGSYKEYGRGGSFESIHKDCRVIGPAAESSFSRYFQPLRERFVQEARGAEAPPSPNRVRLVIVDSVRDEAPNPASEDEACDYRSTGDYECSPHGWALANLAKDLLCDPSRTSCEADIESRRVLRWTYEIQPAGRRPIEKDLGTDGDGGGFYGYRSDLATAIRREVAYWWQRERRSKLILNLSVGWEALYGENAPTVRGALEDAVCRGALVVAAAGNRLAGPASLERPLLPAAWEQIPAPSPARCQDLLGEPPPASYLSRTSYRPLLYAVGGVQQDGRVLSKARPNATPRLVAYGDHAPVLHPSSPPRREPSPLPPPVEARPLTTLTGTSVSTLVVSAAAAARWNDLPRSSPFDIMDILWRTGTAADEPVDFCLDPKTNCPRDEKARRVFVHPPASPPNMPWPGLQPPIDSDTPAFTTAGRIGFSKVAHIAACDPDVLVYGDEPPAYANLCPQRWRFDIAAQPWLGPQPGSDHNPDCTYSSGSPGTLVLEFDPCFRIQGMPALIDDLTLVVGEKAYRLPGSFTLGAPGERCPSAPGNDDPRRVQIVLADPPFENLHPMYLAVTVTDTTPAKRTYGTITPILHVQY